VAWIQVDATGKMIGHYPPAAPAGAPAVPAAGSATQAPAPAAPAQPPTRVATQVATLPPASAITPGQLYQLPDKSFWVHTGGPAGRWYATDANGQAVAASSTPAPVVHPAGTSAPVVDPPHVAPPNSDPRVQLYFAGVWMPGLRSHIVASHGVVGPGVRQAIHDAFLPGMEAMAEAGLIDATGAIVGGDGK
jgi:hypothetical protein